MSQKPDMRYFATAMSVGSIERSSTTAAAQLPCFEHACAGAGQRVAETGAGALGLVDVEERRAEVQPVGPIAPVDPEHRHVGPPQARAAAGRAARWVHGPEPHRRRCRPSQPSGWQKSFCMSMTRIAVRARSICTWRAPALDQGRPRRRRSPDEVGPRARHPPLVARTSAPRACVGSRTGLFTVTRP